MLDGLVRTEGSLNMGTEIRNARIAEHSHRKRPSAQYSAKQPHNENQSPSRMEQPSNSSIGGSSSHGDPPNFDLHRAAYEGDLDKVKACVGRGDDVNTRDKHGNSPLSLALHFMRADVVNYLLQHGADPTLKSKAGWSPIHEALASGSKELVTAVHCALEKDSRNSFQKKLAALRDALLKLPDFYMELEWEFHSWVPFLSRFCPSDRYKIWKKGDCLRADSSLVGYDNMAWIRGNVSVIYVGNANGVGQLSIVDHQHELVENAADGLVDLTPREADDEVTELFNQELISTQASVEEVKFSVAKTWLGSDKTSRVEGRYNCKIYNVDGLQYRVLHRCLKESLLPAKSADGKKPTIPHSTGDELKFPWDRYIAADNKGKPIPLLYKNETINVKEKNFKGSVHLSKDFPLKLVDFLPIAEVLAPTNRGFQKFADFVRLKLPDDGFPVKLELPVFPTVTGLATFSLFEEKKAEEFAPDTFVVPSKYKRTKIRFRKGTEESSK